MHVFGAWNKRDLYSDKKQDEMELAVLSGSASYMSQASGLGGLSGLERMKPAETAGQYWAKQQRLCSGLPLPTMKGAAPVKTHGEP